MAYTGRTTRSVTSGQNCVRTVSELCQSAGQHFIDYWTIPIMMINDNSDEMMNVG